MRTRTMSNTLADTPSPSLSFSLPLSLSLSVDMFRRLCACKREGEREVYACVCECVCVSASHYQNKRWVSSHGVYFFYQIQSKGLEDERREPLSVLFVGV